MEKVFGEKGKEMTLKGYVLPPLPKMSAARAGSMASLVMGSVNATASAPPAEEGGGPPQEGGGDAVAAEGTGADATDGAAAQRAGELAKLQQAGVQLQADLAVHAVPGAALVDKADGKTIGKVVAGPAPGTTVLLAQMRLDRLGLLGNLRTGKWLRENKVLIGDGAREYWYLPYLLL